MKIKNVIIFGVLLCGLLMMGGGVWAMSSGSYAINWDVIGGGGEPASSASYGLRGTIGQAAGESSFSTNYELGSGYWHPVGTGDGVCQDEPSPEVGFASIADELILVYHYEGHGAWGMYWPEFGIDTIGALEVNEVYLIYVDDNWTLSYGTQTYDLEGPDWNYEGWRGC